MAAGALVVAHDNPFNRWVMGDGGLYFRAAADLGQRLDNWPTGHDRNALIAQAQARCRDAFLWPRVLSGYAKVVDTLVHLGRKN